VRQALTLGCLWGSVVVGDEMDVDLSRHIGLDVAPEGGEFLVTVSGFAVGDDRAVEHVEAANRVVVP
jgi:hypothetical protein